MAGMSDYLETAILNEVFRNTNYAVPTNTYVSLHTADPTDAGLTAAEVSGNNYSRALVNKDGSTAPFWTAPATSGGGQKVDNNSTVSFPVASGSWGTITHIGIWDASSAGNMLFSGALTASKVVGANDQLTFPATTLVVTLD